MLDAAYASDALLIHIYERLQLHLLYVAWKISDCRRNQVFAEPCCSDLYSPVSMQSIIGAIALFGSLLLCAALDLPLPDGRAPVIVSSYHSTDAILADLLNATVSSKYLISDCGSRTQQIENAINLARKSATDAITFSQMGISTGNIYTAFFKTDKSKQAVTSMLQNIANLKPIRVLLPSPLTATPPEFICVAPDTAIRYKSKPFDPFAECEKTKALAMTVAHTRYIFLCDSFVRTSATPSSLGPRTGPADQCPKVTDNAFPRGAVSLSMYQRYILLHEMVHFYLGSKTLRQTSNPKEVYDWTECVRLNAGLSLRNPENYQAFIASKSFQSQLVGQYQKISAWLMLVAGHSDGTEVRLKSFPLIFDYLCKCVLTGDSYRCVDAPDPSKPPFSLGVADTALTDSTIEGILQGDDPTLSLPSPDQNYTVIDSFDD